MPVIKRKGDFLHFSVTQKPKLEGLTIAYHGNYCGPNWSGGKYQGSIGQGGPNAVDALDRICQVHDASYNRTSNNLELYQADKQFSKDAWKYGMKGKLAATAVRAQSMYRKLFSLKSVDTYKPNLLLQMRRKNVKSRRPKYVRKRKYKKPKKYNKRRNRSYTRRRRSPRRIRNNRFNIVDHKTEFGGIVQDTNAIYIGHGTTAASLWRAMFESALLQLLYQEGYPIGSMNEPPVNATMIGRQFGVNWNYGNPDDVATVTAVTITNIAWKDICFALYQSLAVQWKADIALSTDVQVPNIVSFFLRSTGTPPGIPLVKDVLVPTFFYVRDSHITFNTYSSLRIQNRTASGQENGTLIDVNNTNPLEGYLYTTNIRNNFQFDFGNQGPIVNGGWCPNQNSGIIKDVANNFGNIKWARQPPPKRLVNASKATKVMITPGQVLIHELKWQKTMLFSKFCSMAMTGLKTSNLFPSENMDMGKAAVFGLEKLVYDRTETQDVRVGFEVNQTISASITKVYRRPAGDVNIDIVPQ